MSDKDKKLLVVASAAVALVVGIFVVRGMGNGDSSPLPVVQSPVPAQQADAAKSDTEDDSAAADSGRRSRRSARRMSDADQTGDRLARDESEIEEGNDERDSVKRSSVRRPKRSSRRGARAADEQDQEEETETKSRRAPMGAVDL